MKAVLNPSTNEVLGFDDNMSDDEIGQAIQSDKDGRPMPEVNPTPYEAIVRPALEQAKLTGNNQILYDARKRALAEDPFNKAILHGATFGLTDDNDPETKKAHGIADTLGNLVGQTGSILATAGLGDLLGLGKVAATVGNAAKAALPAEAAAVTVGSGAILPVTAGELAATTAASVTSSAGLGALYNGITESTRQGKVFAEDHQAPDVVKLGESVLKGAVSWAPYGIGGSFAHEAAPGVATGAAAVAGAAYVVSKADGQSEADARFNSILMGIFHIVSHFGAPKSTGPEASAKGSGDAEASPASEQQQTAANDKSKSGSNPVGVPMTPEMRQSVVEDLQNAVAGYTKAKNGMTEQGNLHQMVGDEFIKSEAQTVLDEQNANLMAAAEEAKARQPELEKQAAEEAQAAKVASEEKLAGTFKDPYEAKMLDYLSQFIPAKYIVRMDGTERLRLANSPRKQLVAYKAIHDEAAAQEAAGDVRAAAKLENDILLRRTQNNTLQEVTSSDTLTKALTSNVTQKVIAAQDKTSTGSEVSEGAASAASDNVDVSRGTVSTRQDNTGDLDNQTADKSGVLKQAEATPGSQSESSTKGSEKDIVSEKSSSPESIASKGPEVKESGLARSVEESAIAKGLVDDLGELPSYQRRDFKDVAKRAAEFIAKDPELAKKIALGEAPEQDDLRSPELFKALQIKAEKEGDSETIRELGTNDKAAQIAAEAGQRVKAYDMGNEDNPVRAIRTVKEARQAEIAKKPQKAIEKEQKQDVNDMKESIKKRAPKLKDWNEFLEAIRC